LQDQGIQNITGSKDSVREAFKVGLIEDGESWMDMIKDRNQTVHTYNEATAEAIATNVQTRFFALFVTLCKKMQGLHDNAT
jgi:nucleotidyltransferase substrate binding protein (TIGR01987 family)